MSDPEISDNLRRIVPNDLSPTGLVEGARRKRRRRTGMVGAAAALLIVGLAVPVALNMPNNLIIAQPANTPSPRVDGEPTEVPAPASVLPGAAACYNDDGTPISWSQEASAPAEPGAVRAWFCGDYSPETGRGFVGPLEPLTSGLDTLIKDVQAADVIDLTLTTCTADYNLSFNAVFEYANGARRIIGGDRHGCRTTYDGGVARAGADEFYGALYAAWQKQRETETVDEVVPNICPGPLSLITMEPWDAVQASVCGENKDGSWSASYLSDDLVKAVTESMRTMLQSPEEGKPLPSSSAPEQRVWLTLSNKFTDYQTLVRHEDGLYRAYDGEGLEWFWAPSKELSARLDEALAAHSTDVPPAGQPADPATVPAGPATPVGTGQPSENAPRPWIPEECHDASTGELVSTDLPDGRLPQGAQRVWFCANGEMQIGAPTPPMEPLVEPGLVTQAEAAFNDLAPLPANQACTMELGSSYLVVHEYADGVRYAVELQDYGCRSVTGGDVVKENSALYKQKLLDLWSQQRNKEATTQTRPGPLCAVASSLFVIHPEESKFSSGAACVGAAQVDGVATLARDEVAIPDDILALITDQIAGAPLNAAEVGQVGDSLVLLTRAGDPFVLLRLEDGTFYWPDGEDAKVWTPAGKAVAWLDSVFAK